jgi:hypothetical protein
MIRKIGLILIVLAIIFALFAWSIDPASSENREDLGNAKNASNARWVSLLLVLAGIGFILYDKQEKHGIIAQPRVKEKKTEEQKVPKEAVLDCPNCNQKTKFPYSMIGSIVECPNCKTKVNIEGVQAKIEGDEDFKWE